jgi:hypothetical protein
VHYFGDYELIEEIARGGMGVVWRARQVSLNRTVAVKMILAGQFANEAEVKRFRVEAEAAANLQHPNIVAIHEIGEHEGQHYFSMDFIAGRNLAEHAAAQSLAPLEIARLTKTLAEAVHYAHQRGTLHRDLKPANILIDEQGQPHITDFGLAKRWEAPAPEAAPAVPAPSPTTNDLTQTGAVMGSPSYMAPEQAAARAELIGPATDVYSLGAILYQLLTGQPPHRGATALDTIERVLGEEPTAPRKLRDYLPEDLETICLKCLEKAPERRYATARQLAEELARFIDDEPILAKPASPLRKAWSWTLRNPWAITGLVSLLIFGLSVVAYGLWETNRYLVWRHAQATANASLPFALVFSREIGPMWTACFLAGNLFFFACMIDFQLRKATGHRLNQARLTVHWLSVAGFLALGFWALKTWVTLGIWTDASWWATAALGGMFVQPMLWCGLQVSWILLRERLPSLSGFGAPAFYDPRQVVKLEGRFSYYRAWRIVAQERRQQYRDLFRQTGPLSAVIPLGVLTALSLVLAPNSRPAWIGGAWASFGFVRFLAALVKPAWGGLPRADSASAIVALVAAVVLFQALGMPILWGSETVLGVGAGLLSLYWLTRHKRKAAGEEEKSGKPRTP